MASVEEFEKLGEKEVRKRLASHVYGEPRNTNYITAQTWLRTKELETEELRAEESLSISRKALEVSTEANANAVEANSIATKALVSSRSAAASSRSANKIAISAIILSISMMIKEGIVWYSKN